MATHRLSIEDLLRSYWPFLPAAIAGCLLQAHSWAGWEGGKRGERNEHTVRKAKRHHQVSQPKQRILLRATAWLLLPKPSRLRHSAPGPRERPSQRVKGLLEGQVLGSWAIPPMLRASARSSLVIWREGSTGHPEAWNLFLRSRVTDSSWASLRFSFLLYRDWIRWPSTLIPALTSDMSS